jgi:peptidoglycan/LPS O-acetylase OafA/YrhL
MAAMKSNRNKLIDLLRGVSILLVLIHHFQNAYRLDESVWVSIFPRALWRPLLKNGNYGVTIFFVISGFLITSTSLKRFGSLGRINLPSFYSYRFARIAPNITLMVGFVVVLGPAAKLLD